VFAPVAKMMDRSACYASSAARRTWEWRWLFVLFVPTVDLSGGVASSVTAVSTFEEGMDSVATAWRRGLWERHAMRMDAAMKTTNWFN
jgi:hypothetical protein